MEEEEEDKSQPLSPTLTLTLTLTLGLGLGLGLLCFTSPQTLAPLKPLSTTVKLAHAALAVSRRPHAPLLLVSKALLKARNLRSPPTASNRRLKASIAALNLLRHAFLQTGFALGGLKLCKNVVRVTEGFYGLRLDSTVKNGFKTAVVLVKAASIAVEVERRVLLAEWERRLRRRLPFGGTRGDSRTREYSCI